MLCCVRNKLVKQQTHGLNSLRGQLRFVAIDGDWYTKNVGKIPAQTPYVRESGDVRYILLVK